MSRVNEGAMQLEAQVSGDGSVGLRWRSMRVDHYHLMLVRTGSVPAYRALQLASHVNRYEITGLSRHQRYRMAVLGTRGKTSACSPWLSVTPRAGLLPRTDEQVAGVQDQLARIARLTVMPQDQRITAYWSVTRGLIDAFVIELLQGDRVLERLSVEPEVTSLSIDGSRGLRPTNGQIYGLRVQPRFASLLGHGPPAVRCVPAAQGEERAANRSLAQAGLIYPSLELGPEVRVFDDEEGSVASVPASRVLCYHCGGEVAWRSYRLRCVSCNAEFVPNGRGAYLDSNRLRFGTCRCCLPKKIIIQRAGSSGLLCAHSGKEHIRLPDGGGVRLIEELPFGLCQCCRPRRPLLRRGSSVRCSSSAEVHRNEGGAWVLAPSQPVFDAAAIDELLDAGLAEICASGVSRGSGG